LLGAGLRECYGAGHDLGASSGCCGLRFLVSASGFDFGLFLESYVEILRLPLSGSLRMTVEL